MWSLVFCSMPFVDCILQSFEATTTRKCDQKRWMQASQNSEKKNRNKWTDDDVNVTIQKQTKWQTDAAIALFDFFSFGRCVLLCLCAMHVWTGVHSFVQSVRNNWSRRIVHSKHNERISAATNRRNIRSDFEMAFGLMMQHMWCRANGEEEKNVNIFTLIWILNTPNTDRFRSTILQMKNYSKWWPQVHR